MKVLFVEDDPGIGRVVSRGLAGEGYEVEVVYPLADRPRLDPRPPDAGL